MEKQLVPKGIIGLIERILDLICGFVESILTWVLIVEFVLCCVIVILRYCFNTSFYGSQELLEYLFILLSANGAAVLFHRNEHISVDFFTKASILFQKVLRVVQYGIVIALQSFILWLSIGWIKKIGSFLTPMLHIEQRWIQYAIPISMILGILFCLGQIVQVFFQTNKQEELPQ